MNALEFYRALEALDHALVLAYQHAMDREEVVKLQAVDAVAKAEHLLVFLKRSMDGSTFRGKNLESSKFQAQAKFLNHFPKGEVIPHG